MYAPPHTCDLVAAGSLLQRLNRSHRLHRLGFKRRLHIWGTGSLRATDALGGRHDVCAVRGPLTRSQIDAANPSVPLGDPGLLADRLVPSTGSRRWGLGVIPHKVDRDHPDVSAFLERCPEARLLDITAPVEQLLRSIADCERVLSSSLHGLIFADAFGVPNTWFTASGALIGGRHKFDDYFGAFGLSLEPVRLTDVAVNELGADYRRPGLDTIKSDLLDSFPWR